MYIMVVIKISTLFVIQFRCFFQITFDQLLSIARIAIVQMKVIV